eukprot:gnl/MRDRNA2_/MRDRNA2_90154_c0_seq1.p1 gnl/MRDRNA2_/MRDRNA2_90154_c0~~gnl/MRDRNA2_/MRDRNA2_90154_c0_seq1.p1  ORF type:complete len:571 (-),score=97.22 gnl/MRDRNA2_/MRDRNA2_90154_c0_seq1:168-1880(-)
MSDLQTPSPELLSGSDKGEDDQKAESNFACVAESNTSAGYARKSYMKDGESQKPVMASKKSLPALTQRSKSNSSTPSSSSRGHSTGRLRETVAVALSKSSSAVDASVGVSNSQSKLRNAVLTVVNANKENDEGVARKNSNLILLCPKDRWGKSYDTALLRARKKEAVFKGMHFIHKLLTRKNCEALYEIGDDAACLFFEIWYTSSDSRIRQVAKDMSRDLLQRYVDFLQMVCSKGWPELPWSNCKHTWSNGKTRRDWFFDCAFLLRAAIEMELDSSEVLHKMCDELWTSEGYADTNELFGLSQDSLEDVTPGDWVWQVVRMMLMQFLQVLCPRRYPIRWGLVEAFQALRRQPLVPPPYDSDLQFHNSVYAATHIVFALSAYGAIKTDPKWAGWLFKYCRKSLEFYMDTIRKHGPGIPVDIDGIAELLDVIRGCGLTDATDPLLCEGTVWLLDRQQDNGAWPLCHPDEPYCTTGSTMYVQAKDPSKAEADGKGGKDAYSRLHPTWVATQALRDRNFELERRGNAAWAQYVPKCVAKSGLATAEFKVKYQPSCVRRKSKVRSCSVPKKTSKN